MVDVSALVARTVRDSGVRAGLCLVFVPHTTAAVTINENADPSVQQDILSHLERIAPPDGPYAHSEGNGDSHIKASIIGSSVTVIIDEGQLQVGRWQGIYFCEFDGPRSRQLYVKIL
jgi:secondary thiamine-phosphate synthase enzyme